MEKIKIFFSFAPEDKDSFELLAGQFKNPFSTFEISDCSKHDPCNEEWKTKCRDRIKKAQILIMLVGNQTYKAETACLEVAIAKEEHIPVFGIYTQSDKKGPVPESLAGHQVIEWSWDGLKNLINQLAKKSPR